MRVAIEKTSATSNNTNIIANPNYLQVEYLESSGTQYINSQVYGSNTLKTEITYQELDTAIQTAIFGCYGATTQSYYIYNNFEGKYHAGFGGWKNTLIAVDTDKHTAVLDNSKLYLDNKEIVSIAETTFTTNYPLLIFNMYNTSGEVYSSNPKRVYSCKMWDNNTLVRNFIPALRKSDMKPGMYDKVSGNFYTNAGSGEFTYGDIIDITLPKDILANPNYFQLDYLESTGTQYITTDVVPTDTTGYEVIFDAPADNNKDNIIFGCREDSGNTRYWLDVDWTTNDNIEWGFGKFSANDPTYRYSMVASDAGRTFISQCNMYNCRKCNLNGTNYLMPQEEPLPTITYPIYIFCANKYGTADYFTSVKIRSVKITEGTKLTHNYIPALRKSDMKPGMFDKVTGNFYTNAGTGEFKYGSIINAVLPKEYRELEYLESTGKQRIDTGIYMNSTYGVEIEAKQTSTTTGVSRYLFGDAATTQTRYMIAISSASNRYICDFVSNANRIDSGVSGYDGNWHTHKIENKTYYVDGVLKGSASITDFTATNTSCLFSATTGSPFIANYWQIKKSQIWDNNGKLLQCLIPALRVSDSKPGMFDLVGGNFYINVGGDEFSYKEYFDSIYDEVEYIYGGTGSNIDTGFVFKDHLFKLDMAFENKSSRVIIGSAAGQACYFESNSNNKYSLNSNGSGLVIDLDTSVRRVVETKRTYDSTNDASTVHMTVEGQTVTRTTSGDPNKGINFTLFPSFDGYTGYAYNYGTKVYDLTTNELVADLIPCVIKATNEAGMYDKVTNTFKSNSGTSDLVAGPKVKTKSRIVRNIKTYDPVKLGYEVLEYLQANYNQIIDTEIIPTNTTGMRAIVSDISPSSDVNFLGCRTSNTRFMFNMYHYNTLTAGFKDWLNSDPVSYEAGKKYELKLNYYNNRKFEGEGVSLSFDKTIDETLPSVSIFAQHTGGVNAYNLNAYKCYEFEMTDGNQLIMHLLPVRRILDGELGMYDTISGKFFRNLKDTQFIAGPKVTKSLPAEFEEIEYIRASGTQFIDTGIAPNISTVVEIKCQAAGQSMAPIGAGSLSATNDKYQIFASTQYYSARIGANANTNSASEAPYNSLVVAKLDGPEGKFYVNDISVNINVTQTTLTSRSLTLFKRNMDDGEPYSPFSGDIYYCKIWKDGILVRDMIPVRRITDGELGVYDKVSNAFLTNSGTGTLIAGPSVDVRLPAEYTELDYLESTGTQYIDTGIKIDSTFNIEILAKQPSTQTGKSRYLFGTFDSPNYKEMYIIAIRSGNNKYLLNMNNSYVECLNGYDGNYHEHKVTNNEYFIDGVSYGTVNPSAFNVTNTAYLFQARNVTYGWDTWQIKYSKIWNHDGKLIQHLIPALRKSDGKPGMFDLVEREFLTSATDTDFIAGPSTAKEMIYVDSFNKNYEFIEYLEGDGFSHIDTGVIPSNTMGLKVDFADVSSTLTDYNFIGTRITNNGQRFSINNTNNTFGACFSNYIPTDIPLLPNTRYVAYQNYKNNRKYNFNGIEGNLTEDLTATLPSFMMFAQNTNNGPTRYAYKIYSCQLTDDNKITHEYLPVRRKADSVLGMYDTVTNTFLTNSGEGTFTAGKVVCKIVNRIIT